MELLMYEMLITKINIKMKKNQLKMEINNNCLK